jgi:HK97 family phage major capsid protein
MSDEIKVGARHSAEDLRRIQEIHDHALALGASAPQPVGQTGPIPVEHVTDPSKAIAPDSLIFNGSAVKALGDGKVGGYLVVFGSPKQTDLEGDFFTKETNFGGAQSSPVLYQHGMDASLGLAPIGSGTLKTDDIGVWLDAQLNMRSAYERAIYGMAEAGKLGWSSGTASHLVQREPVHGGKAYRITSWPLGLDASLTPTPAEPRTRALPLKSLNPAQTLQALLQASGEDATKSNADGGASPTQSNNSTEGQIMSDTIETKVDALAAQVSTLVAAMAANTKSEAKAAAAAPGFLTAETPAIDRVSVNDKQAPFKSFGDFLVAVQQRATGTISGENYNRMTDHQTKAAKSNGLNELVGTEGGFLIGPNDVKPITDAMYTTGEILSRVTRNPVSANSNGMTLYGIDQTSRVAGSRFGGVQGYWSAEGVSMTKSKPSFRKVDLRLNKVHALVYATDEMLQDSAYLESTVRRVAPLELQFKVEDAIVSGDGVGKPLGFAPGLVASGAFISATKDSGQTATTVTIGNLAAMWGRLYAGGQKNAIILCNQDVIPQLFKIASANTSTTTSFLLPPGAGASPYFTFFGRPIIPVEYLSTMGTLADIVVIDPTQYQVIDKGGIQEASSMHVQFLTDEMVYRFTYRVDGAPLWAAPLTPYKGSATVSPFVGVETRS